MTKKLLLAAAAVSAIGFAGAAGATEIMSAKVSNVTLTTTGATKSSYALANESITATLANRQTTTTTGHNEIVSALSQTPTPTYFEPGAMGTNYTATLTLTGATFQGAVAAGGIAVTGQQAGCAIASPTIVSGGGAGQSAVTVVFTVPNTCTLGAGATAPTGVTFQAPFTMDAAASTVSANVAYAVATTGAAYGGAAGTAVLVQKADGYSVGVSAKPQSATALPTSFALGSATPYYVALVGNSSSNDNIIGSVKAGAAAAPTWAAGGSVRADMANTALPAMTYDVSVAGNFAVLVPGAAVDDATAKAATSGAVLTVNAGKTSAAATGLAAPQTIYVHVPAANTVSTTSPQAVTATVTPKFAAASTLVTLPGPQTSVSLETIGLQGTNFVAPWVQSANANYNTVLRLSNSGSVTGPVMLTLTSPNAAATSTTCGTAQLAKLANVPANGELAVNSADLTTCFGDFGRGDLRVTVQAEPANLSAKLRIVNPGNLVTEQSLGSIAQGVATVN